MTVALKQENAITEIGPGGLLHSLFSTIAMRLETRKWGSRFPTVVNKLYQGGIGQPDAQVALAELQQIRNGLEKLPPSAAVWDAEDLSASPPWSNVVMRTNHERSARINHRGGWPAAEHELGVMKRLGAPVCLVVIAGMLKSPSLTPNNGAWM